jgi:hypothetical protein
MHKYHEARIEALKKRIEELKAQVKNWKKEEIA